MDKQGKESFPELATHFYLDGLVAELHFSLFNALVNDMDRVVTWPAMDGSSYYAAANLQPFVDYDRDPRPINAYRAVSRDWEVIRVTDDFMANESNLKSFITSLTPRGLELNIIEHHGFPMDHANTRAIDQWMAAITDSRRMQHGLGMSEPTDMDYAELENAIYDLRAFNSSNIPNRSAFDDAEHLERKITGIE
jgi:hypothetical protein